MQMGLLSPFAWLVRDNIKKNASSISPQNLIVFSIFYVSIFCLKTWKLKYTKLKLYPVILYDYETLSLCRKSREYLITGYWRECLDLRKRK
jgi:hypothetical protein